jgi:hypothetical protein
MFMLPEGQLIEVQFISYEDGIAVGTLGDGRTFTTNEDNLIGLPFVGNFNKSFEDRLAMLEKQAD